DHPAVLLGAQPIRLLARRVTRAITRRAAGAVARRIGNTIVRSGHGRLAGVLHLRRLHLPTRWTAPAVYATSQHRHAGAGQIPWRRYGDLWTVAARGLARRPLLTGVRMPARRRCPAHS